MASCSLSSSCNLLSNERHFQIHAENLRKISEGEVGSRNFRELVAANSEIFKIFQHFKNCLNSALKFVGEGTACRGDISYSIEGLEFLNSGECDSSSDTLQQLEEIAKAVDKQMPHFKSTDLINLQLVSTTARPDGNSTWITSTAPSMPAAVPQNIFSAISRSTPSLQQASAVPVLTTATPVPTSAGPVPAASSFVESKNQNDQDDQKEPVTRLIPSALPPASASAGGTVTLTYLNNFMMNLNSWKTMIAKSEDRNSLLQIHSVIQTLTIALGSVKRMLEPKNVEATGPTSPILDELIVEEMRPQRRPKNDDDRVLMCLKQMQNYFEDSENFKDYLGENAKRLMSDLTHLQNILNNFETQVKKQITAINPTKSAEGAAVSSESR